MILNIVNPSGLTVGIRIVLSVGCLFVPLFVTEIELLKSIKRIFNSSILLLLLGVLSGHWIFVLAGFIPFLFLMIRISWVLFTSLSTLILLLSGSSFTIQLTILVSFLLLLFSKYNFLSLRKNIFTSLFIGLIPLLITITTLNIKSDNYSRDSSGNYIEKLGFKFFDDRKPLWDATFEQIVSTNFWIAPAGRPTPIDGYWNKEDEWTAGAHNIFLEIPRQIGNFGGLIILGILIYHISKIGLNNFNYASKYLYISFISVFVVYGLVGNSLVYDGVGFLYWLLIGQFYHLKSTYAV